MKIRTVKQPDDIYLCRSDLAFSLAKELTRHRTAGNKDKEDAVLKVMTIIASVDKQ